MTPDHTLTDVAAESCYCVCHSSFSSRAWCDHCKGDNEVNRVPRCTVPDESNANGTCARALPCAVHPTLTDEELAEIERSVAAYEWAAMTPYARRLIAALRASSAEVERLQDVMRRLLADTLADCRTGAPDSLCGCPAHVKVRETAAEAESLLP